MVEYLKRGGRGNTRGKGLTRGEKRKFIDGYITHVLPSSLLFYVLSIAGSVFLYSSWEVPEYHFGNLLKGLDCPSFITLENNKTQN